MNIQLANTEEFIDGKSTGNLGQVLIRYGSCHSLGACKYRKSFVEYKLIVLCAVGVIMFFGSRLRMERKMAMRK